MAHNGAYRRIRSLKRAIGPTPPSTMAAQPQPQAYKAYKDRYCQEPDILNGGYAPQYERFSTTSTSTAEQLYDHVLTSSQVIPKVYLFLTNHQGKATIGTLHRPTRYSTHPVNPSQWDGRAFAFLDDIIAGNYVQLVEFPRTAFELGDEQVVPTVAGIDAQLATLGPNDTYIPAPAEGAADTEKLRTRQLVPVPHAYLNLVFGRAFTPRSLWQELSPRVGSFNVTTKRTGTIYPGSAATNEPAAGLRHHATPE